MAQEAVMGNVIRICRIVSINGTLHLSLPKYMCISNSIKRGDLFEIEGDILLPNIYTIKKIGNINNGIGK